MFKVLNWIELNQSKLSKATMISSDKRGLYWAMRSLSAVTWAMRSLRLVVHCPFCWQDLMSLASKAFLSYFLSSSMKVFFISVRKEP